jgi:AAA domain
LNLKGFAEAKGFTFDELRRFGVTVKAGRIAVPYKNSDGSVFRHRMRSAVDDGKGFSWIKDEAEGTLPYGLDRPVPWGAFLYLVEGETDCWSLWLSEIPAIGLPGASNVACLDRVDFAGVQTIIAIEEPGDAGALMPHKAAMRLYDAGFSGVVVSIRLAPFKDARAAFNANRAGLAGTIRAAWKARTPIPRPEPVKKKQRGLFESVSLAEAFADDQTIEHLVEGLVPAGGSMVVGAKKKVGKSVLLLNLARGVAHGGTFLGRRCRKGAVVYVSLDEPKAITLERMEALGLKDDPDIFLIATRNPPDDWGSALRNEVKKRKAVLVIVDTLAKLARIQEINSYGEWNRAYAPLQSIAEELGCAYVVTVHNRKDGQTSTDSMAGSMAIGAGVDTTLVMSRGADGTRTIETEQRHGQDMARSVLSMDRDTYELSISGEAWLSAQRDLERMIFASIGSEALAIDEITRRVRLRSLVVKRAVYASVDGGWLERLGSGKRGDPYLYKAIAGALSARDQETAKAPPDKGLFLVPPLPIHNGDQETDDSDDSEKGWSVKVGPTSDLAGSAGTGRDLETGEPDLLELYAESQGL